jgi:aryl-alcohol dehydrogenase-like predicted oxidoreductase
MSDAQAGPISDSPVPEHRRLGASGLTVSVVGLGCNNFGMKLGLDESRPVIEAALEAGITLFDTSDSYGDSEEILGQVLAEGGAGRRDEIVLATKFGSHLKGALGPDRGARGSRRYIRRAVERSLRRLRTDHIDLYQLHRPDPLTPIEETLAALSELVDEGKVRYIGSSNFAAWQVADADWTARTGGHSRFISAQNEYSLLERSAEAELVPALDRFGVGLLPYFPLASGLLTGKYRRGEDVREDFRLRAWGMMSVLTDANFDVLEKLSAFADERGISMIDLAIGGLAAQPTVASVIAGATSVEQIRTNVAAGSWRPGADDLAALDEIVPSRRPS